ncbi:MAG: hypothetical protein ACYDCJ_11110 [Gammaproteobacteria bacterium]
MATLLGLMGTALVIVQALFWIPSRYANLAVLILTAFVPLIAAVVFALVPRRVEEDNAQGYSVRAPMVWITLGLPVLLTVLVMALIGAGGNFDNFAGLALLLAANSGRNLRDWVRALLLRAADTRP